MSASSLWDYGRTCPTVLEGSGCWLFDIPSEPLTRGRVGVMSKPCVRLCWVAPQWGRLAWSSFELEVQPKVKAHHPMSRRIPCVV